MIGETRAPNARSAATRWALAVGLSTLAAACAPPPPAPPVHPTSEGWARARSRLEALRLAADGGDARTAGEPHTLRLALALREPYTGRTLEARGAVALAPPDALRMILLGPGGTTALDLWVSHDRFRFVVPAIDLARRGDRHTGRASMRGLPVDFLSFWLLRPFRGSLLWHAREASSDRLVLRDADAIIEVVAHDDGRIQATRSVWSAPDAPARLLEVETVEADGLGCSRARYHQRSTGLDVTVTCEGREPRPPPPKAFIDPDLAEAAP